MKVLRRRIYNVLEHPDRSGPVSRGIDLLLIALIALNVAAVTLETVGPIYERYKFWFDTFDAVSVVIFTIEYLVRLWVVVEASSRKKSRFPRLRYAITPMAIIDLLAIAPFYLSMLFALDLRFLRVLRLLRVFKLTRYSQAMSMLLEVFQEEFNAFFAAFSILFVLLILSASGVYLVEHHAQPEAFGSIPKAMWWALVTLTTVGYGDVTPLTVAGKIFGGLIAVVGVGMAALPAGILASGLADHLHRRRDDLRREFRVALEDGIICEDEAAEIEALRKKLGISKSVALNIMEDVKATTRCTCPNCGTEFQV